MNIYIYVYRYVNTNLLFLFSFTVGDVILSTPIFTIGDKLIAAADNLTK